MKGETQTINLSSEEGLLEVGNQEVLGRIFPCEFESCQTGVDARILAVWKAPGLAAKTGQCSKGPKPRGSSMLCEEACIGQT